MYNANTNLLRTRVQIENDGKYIEMLKERLKRLIPDHNKLKQSQTLNNIFGKVHLDPNLWHFNPNSVANAFSIGLFTCFMPIPFQMLMAATLAIIFRAHIAIAVALVWITNPITLSPIFYFAYKLGTKIITITPDTLSESSSWALFHLGFSQFWKPLLTGLFTLAILSAVAGNIIIRISWHGYYLLSGRQSKLFRTRSLDSRP